MSADDLIAELEKMAGDLRGHGEYRRGLAVALGVLRPAIASLKEENDRLVNWVQGPGELVRLRQRVAVLEQALEPFAAYACLPGFERLPGDMPLTPGSRMAAEQVTVDDFRNAARALQDTGKEKAG